jgi:predicted RNase H-like nuclease (RuvC/YqgF family)
VKNITTYIIIGFIALLTAFVAYDHTELLALKNNQSSILKPITEQVKALENVDKDITESMSELRNEQTNQFVTFTDEVQVQINTNTAEINKLKAIISESTSKSEQLGSKFAEALKSLGAPKNYDKEIAGLKQSIDVINQKLQ